MGAFMAFIMVSVLLVMMVEGFCLGGMTRMAFLLAAFSFKWAQIMLGYQKRVIDEDVCDDTQRGGHKGRKFGKDGFR
jgi:hypothetical protein